VHWNFVDRVFKLVQWAVTIGIIGAFAKARKGTIDGSILLVITIVLLAAFGVALRAMLQALVWSRFPDIDQRGFLYRLIVGSILILVTLGVVWAAFRAVLAIVAARVM
jgi:hypothetical protein